MFIAPLVIISKTWEQPRCPSVGEEINRGTYVHGILLRATNKHIIKLFKKWKEINK